MSIIFLSSCAKPSALETAKNKICFQQTCFAVELAKTTAQRELGLMHRERLADDAGMLFMFPKPGIAGFWMKETLVPLDIIWIDHTQTIQAMFLNLLPCPAEPCEVYRPDVVIPYVLEIPGGSAAALGLKEGDKLEFSLAVDAFEDIE